MKRRLTVIFVAAAVFALLSGAHAAFLEDFEGPLGADLSTKGWTQETWPDNVGQTVLNDTTIDAGMSGYSNTPGNVFIPGDPDADPPIPDIPAKQVWTVYNKMMAPMSSAGGLYAQYVWQTPDTVPVEEHVQGMIVYNDTGWRWGITILWRPTEHNPSYGAAYNDADLPWTPVAITPGMIVDLRMEIYPDTSSWYWREHGDPGWNLVGTASHGNASNFNKVRIMNMNMGELSRVDTIEVGIIPEPGSLAALAMGLSGLVGFAIRRRR